MASYLVTGGAGFIGSHLAEELVRRGQRVRVVDSLITGKRRNLDHIARRRIPRRRSRRPGRRARAPSPAWTTCCTRRRFRRCRGRWRSDHLEPRERRRDAQRAGGRARRGRQAARLRRLVVGLRRHADAAQARGHADQSAVALRAAEARRRAVLPDVHAALRLRDGDDPLLQRVRAAAGSRVAVLGRHLAVLDGAARRAASRSSTATASRRATSPTSPTSSTACCARARRRRRPAR